MKRLFTNEELQHAAQDPQFLKHLTIASDGYVLLQMKKAGLMPELSTLLSQANIHNVMFILDHFDLNRDEQTKIAPLFKQDGRTSSKLTQLLMNESEVDAAILSGTPLHEKTLLTSRQILTYPSELRHLLNNDEHVMADVLKNSLSQFNSDLIFEMDRDLLMHHLDLFNVFPEAFHEDNYRSYYLELLKEHNEATRQYTDYRDFLHWPFKKGDQELLMTILKQSPDYIKYEDVQRLKGADKLLDPMSFLLNVRFQNLKEFSTDDLNEHQEAIHERLFEIASGTYRHLRRHNEHSGISRLAHLEMTPEQFDHLLDDVFLERLFSNNIPMDLDSWYRDDSESRAKYLILRKKLVRHLLKQQDPLAEALPEPLSDNSQQSEAGDKEGLKNSDGLPDHLPQDPHRRFPASLRLGRFLHSLFNEHESDRELKKLNEELLVAYLPSLLKMSHPQGYFNEFRHADFSHFPDVYETLTQTHATPNLLALTLANWHKERPKEDSKAGSGHKKKNKSVDPEEEIAPVDPNYQPDFKKISTWEKTVHELLLRLPASSASLLCEHYRFPVSRTQRQSWQNELSNTELQNSSTGSSTAHPHSDDPVDEKRAAIHRLHSVLKTVGISQEFSANLLHNNETPIEALARPIPQRFSVEDDFLNVDYQQFFSLPDHHQQLLMIFNPHFLNDFEAANLEPSEDFLISLLADYQVGKRFDYLKHFVDQNPQRIQSMSSLVEKMIKHPEAKDLIQVDLDQQSKITLLQMDDLMAQSAHTEALYLEAEELWNALKTNKRNYDYEYDDEEEDEEDDEENGLHEEPENASFSEALTVPSLATQVKNAESITKSFIAKTFTWTRSPEFEHAQSSADHLQQRSEQALKGLDTASVTTAEDLGPTNSPSLLSKSSLKSFLKQKDETTKSLDQLQTELKKLHRNLQDELRGAIETLPYEKITTELERHLQSKDFASFYFLSKQTRYHQQEEGDLFNALVESMDAATFKKTFKEEPHFVSLLQRKTDGYSFLERQNFFLDFKNDEDNLSILKMLVHEAPKPFEPSSSQSLARTCSLFSQDVLDRILPGFLIEHFPQVAYDEYDFRYSPRRYFGSEKRHLINRRYTDKELVLLTQKMAAMDGGFFKNTGANAHTVEVMENHLSDETLSTSKNADVIRAETLAWFEGFLDQVKDNPVLYCQLAKGNLFNSICPKAPSPPETDPDFNSHYWNSHCYIHDHFDFNIVLEGARQIARQITAHKGDDSFNSKLAVSVLEQISYCLNSDYTEYKKSSDTIYVTRYSEEQLIAFAKVIYEEAPLLFYSLNRIGTQPVGEFLAEFGNAIFDDQIAEKLFLPHTGHRSTYCTLESHYGQARSEKPAEILTAALHYMIKESRHQDFEFLNWVMKNLSFKDEAFDYGAAYQGPFKTEALHLGVLRYFEKHADLQALFAVGLERFELSNITGQAAQKKRKVMRM